MEPIETRNLIYPGMLNQPGYCKLQVYTTVSGKTVCVVTEQDDNPGASVTNCAENIKVVLNVKYGPHILVETYGDGVYDLVEYDPEVGGIPKWSRIDLEGLLNQ